MTAGANLSVGMIGLGEVGQALARDLRSAGVHSISAFDIAFADRGSRHWINLQRLVQRTLPTLRATLLQVTAPILLVSTGLLALGFLFRS